MNFRDEHMNVDVYAGMSAEERAAWHRWGQQEGNEFRYRQFTEDAEQECLELIDDILESDSFGVEEEETKPERLLRFIVQGLSQHETVSTILQLRDYSSYLSEGEEEEE
jgi:hypothetical protein